MTQFLINLNTLLDEKNISKNKLLTDLKLGKNSYVNWNNRNALPNGKSLIKMADYFDVSIDYLVGRTSNRG